MLQGTRVYRPIQTSILFGSGGKLVHVFLPAQGIEPRPPTWVESALTTTPWCAREVHCAFKLSLLLSYPKHPTGCCLISFSLASVQCQWFFSTPFIVRPQLQWMSWGFASTSFVSQVLKLYKLCKMWILCEHSSYAFLHHFTSQTVHPHFYINLFVQFIINIYFFSWWVFPAIAAMTAEGCFANLALPIT